MNPRQVGFKASFLTFVLYEAFVLADVFTSRSSTAVLGLILGQVYLPILLLPAYLIGRKIASHLESQAAAIALTAGIVMGGFLVIAIGYEKSHLLRYQKDYEKVQNGNTPCEANAESHPAALIVSQAGTDVQFMKCQGSDQVSYSVDTPYPATAVLREISDRLTKNGWKSLSHSGGWEQFVDGTKKPQRMVHQWIAEWENPNEDVVQYALRYEYPVADQDIGPALNGADAAKLMSLSVVAQLIPASKLRSKGDKN
jgi:hypothetical protein